MRHKTIVLKIKLLLVLTIASFTMVACTGEQTEIREGFSSSLTNVLSSKYQMIIPNDAIFIKGINSNTIRDPMVIILFECPINENWSKDDNGYSLVCQTLKLDESRYSFGGCDEKISARWYDEIGGMLDFKIVDKNDPHTFISYSLGESVLTIRFVGRHPGESFN